MGDSRDTFCHGKELYEAGGDDALRDVSRRKPNIKSRIDRTIEQAVVDLAMATTTSNFISRSPQSSWGLRIDQPNDQLRDFRRGVELTCLLPGTGSKPEGHEYDVDMRGHPECSSDNRS